MRTLCVIYNFIISIISSLKLIEVFEFHVFWTSVFWFRSLKQSIEPASNYFWRILFLLWSLFRLGTYIFFIIFLLFGKLHKTTYITVLFLPKFLTLNTFLRAIIYHAARFSFLFIFYTHTTVFAFQITFSKLEVLWTIDFWTTAYKIWHNFLWFKYSMM